MTKNCNNNTSKSLFLFCSFLCCFSYIEEVAAAGEEGIDWWCSNTPHPGPCNYFLSREQKQHNDYHPHSSLDFLTMTIYAALDRALESRTESSMLAARCRSKRRAVVHRDCNNLIDLTIFQLNYTLQGIRTNASFTAVDVQTWLSTALTNIEICRSGSLDLNVTRFTSPILSANVSELIINCLATNAALMNSTTSYGPDSGFPEWVSRQDRKLLQDASLPSRAIAVVSQDGSPGTFRSIQEAVNYAVSKRVGNGRVVIYVKRGVYRENILISRTMNKVTLVGDGVRYTVITGSRSVSAGFTTYSSATVGIDGIGFIARGITFRNTAGAGAGQAVALRSASDLSVFYACAFDGYQDTLFVHAQRQLYKTCLIYGTVDFIFGNAAVVFQNCILYVRRPLSGQASIVTAQGRGDPFQNTGISIHKCRIMPAPGLTGGDVSAFRTFLGRPWQPYSRTVVMKTFIDGMVAPEGWSKWGDSNSALSTLYYAEYRNFGPGGSTRKRVTWPGYHVITRASVAARFTVRSFIAGQLWLPATGVPFTGGV